MQKIDHKNEKKNDRVSASGVDKDSLVIVLD